MSTPEVTKVAGISLTVRELGAARAFYEHALDFKCDHVERLVDSEAAARFGKGVGSAECARLSLGQQCIELVSFDAAGSPYPRERAANDPWLQHFAIAVSDVEQAFSRLSEHGATPISHGGPQRLPPSTGSVIAYKFRDPEGHPLELSYIPGVAWLEAARSVPDLCLGVDHTAIAVADLDASLEFYVGLLGMRVSAQLVNTGPEQDRLDGLPGVVLDIVVLEPAEPGGPHIELLAYRSPAPAKHGAVSKVNDIAASRTLLTVESLPPLEARLLTAGIPVLNSARRERDALLTRDPDGHLVALKTAVQA